NSQYEGTAEILEFNSNQDVIIHLLSKPEELSYKQVRSILDHTVKFPDGVESELFSIALDIYVDRKYYIYEGLEELEKTDDVEMSIRVRGKAFKQEWEDFKADDEAEYARQIYESMSYYPSKEE
ncbi:MAG: hypothetical protein WCP32_19105, partial [Bacteroidota bacterium]